MEKQPINLVWLKRDLRLRDHAPLANAIQDGLPTLIFYCLEPSLIKHPDYATRHWRFIHESLQDLNDQLQPTSTQVYFFHQEVINVLTLLSKTFNIQHLYSHLEVGLKITFDRDKAVKKWCQKKGIIWKEYGQDGIIRGQKHRDVWKDGLEKHLNSPPIEVALENIIGLNLPSALINQLSGPPLPQSYLQSDPNFQPGGESYAWRYLHSFLQLRSKNYSRQLSKPLLSRTSCSRISPYLAYGNISVRETFQQAKKQAEEKGDHFNLRNFLSRLYWRCHYLQKLESGHYLEFSAINPALNNLGRTQNEEYLQAFFNAQTGIPMVDASLRCLEATGWINFRMRAMLVTYTSFSLWLDWKPVAHHLARLFLDFEPGIHYPQIQMQAGLTGYHTLRIFNPIVQGENHDPNGAFVKQWIPALKDVPSP
jgi:deoxyribodipyrimidine photo-lyase